MIEIIFILSLVVIFFFINLVSASNVGLIESSQWQSNLTAIRYGSISVGDLNNDNYQDTILTGCLTAGGLNCNGGVITKIYINNGTRLVENSQWQQNLTGLGWSSTSFGDIDNDGDLDLALSGCTSATSASGCTGNLFSKIYINNGTSLVESQQWQQNLTAIFDGSVIFGNINKDGKLDLALSGDTINGKIAKIYINNGTSLVESQQWQQNLTAIRSGSLAFGDTDNDGDLDLALTGEANDVTATTKVYINNGSTLTESSQWQQNLILTQDSSLTLGDYNNDGDLDLALIGVGDYLFMYKNNGTTFLEHQKNSGEGGDLGGGLFDGSIAFGDYNNDGDLDFVGMGLESGRNAIYENNESKNHNFSIDSVAGNNFTNNDMHNGPLVWVDLDNDNDLDLISIGTNSIIGILAKVYINNNTIPNTKPFSPITDFSSNYSISNAILNLSWGNGSDAETNTSGLYYNLMMGNSTNNHTIISGIYGGSSGGGTGGGPSAGYFGNMMQRKSISLNVNLSNGTYYWQVQTIDTGLAKSNWSAVQNFTVGTVSDTTAPVISSVSSSVTFSSATITWTTDESSNSSVYYGTTNATTSSSSSSSLVTSHSVGLSSLSSSTFYYYNVSSCDSSNNCNVSSQYNFTTSASGDGGTTSGGGGGGGITTTKNITTLQPKKFDIDFSNVTIGSLEAKQGDIKTFSFNSQIEHSVTILTLTISSATLLITSNPITIQINAGEAKQIDINKDKISDIEIKLVSIMNGKASFSLRKLAGADIVGKEELEEAVRKEALFDVKVYILDKFKEVFPGEEVSAKIEVFNVNNIGQVDVIVNYYLSNNETIFGSGGSDSLAVEAVASSVRSLIIPDDLKPGIYYFNVNVSYKNFTTSGKAEFKIKSKKLIFIEKKWKEIVIITISAIALTTIAIFVYLRMIRRREERLEKEEQKIEKKESGLEKKEARIERKEAKLERVIKKLEIKRSKK